MSRLYAEVIEVRRGDEAPAQFLWRGRLYVVREVLSHWFEAPPWWQDGAAAAALDRELWRVEASAGRAAGSGVYDVAFDWASGQWSLSGVVD
ncbi:MAG: DUF6504 family protein [Actinomycetes bacterium]